MTTKGAPIPVILNPRARGGASARLAAELERELGRRELDIELHVTSAVGHAAELAREIAQEDPRIIVAAGGDGTVHEVANGLLRAREMGAGLGAALGVVPAGTGNDFAKLVGAGGDRAKAYDIIGDARRRAFDVGIVSWEGGSEYFVNGMGTGVDVEVVRAMEGLPRMPGVASYLIGVVRALARFRPIRARIRADDEVLERSLMMVAVGNGTCVGGGFYVCPGAKPDDGRLDLCLVRELGWARIAAVLPRVLRGTHTEMAEVEMRRAEEVDISVLGDGAVFVQLDGELRGPLTGTVRVAVRPGALPVLVAREAGRL